MKPYALKIYPLNRYRQITTPADLFAGMYLAKMEREILANVPLQSYHLLLLFAPPLLVSLVLLIAWRRHFGLDNRDDAGPDQIGADIA